MEDQRSDAGDLTDPAVAESVDELTPESHSADPQSAAAARRHRLPRGKARRSVTAVPSSEEPAAEVTELVESAGEVADVEVTDVESAVETDEPDTDDSATDESANDGSATGEPENDESEHGQPAPVVEPRQVVFVDRRPPGRRALIAIGVAAAMFVGASAFTGAALYPYLADRASAATKFEIASTAANAITTLWTYTPDNMEQLGARSSRFLGGDFRTEYSKYIDAIVPTNKQAQVTNNTEVVGAAVESLNGPDATAIVYTNSTSTSPLTKNIPSMRYLSYRLTLHQDGPEWLVTGMTAITNLDLTPKI